MAAKPHYSILLILYKTTNDNSPLKISCAECCKDATAYYIKTLGIVAMLNVRKVYKKIRKKVGRHTP